MKRFVLALDQGTTSSRALVFDRQGTIQGIAQREFQQHYPKSGWVEHDANEIWETQRQVAIDALAKAKVAAGEIAAIGITNQRETTVVWDRRTGEPIHRAIVWQDRRTADQCRQLRDAGQATRIQQVTGLVLDAYFSATKIGWLLDNVPGARQRAEKGELAFGTIDAWLMWKLSDGRLHVTDPSNASRTMLFDIRRGDWSEEMLSLFRIPRSLLPTVRASSEKYGMTSAAVLGDEMPIGGIAGDQQSALFGQNCLRHGMVKNTYGTGCFMLLNIGDTPCISQHQLLTSVAWRLGSFGPLMYSLEGSVFVAGAAVQWLRDGLGIIRSSAEIEGLAASVADSGDVYFVPALTGLGAPHWDPHARGAIVGLSRGTTAAHLARAALDGIAFQVTDVLEALRQDAGIALQEMRVDGGAAANSLLMQTQADLLQIPVVRPKNLETTALGAAYLAGLAVGFWSAIDELQTIWARDRVFEPAIGPAEAANRCQRWKTALQRSMNWTV